LQGEYVIELVKKSCNIYLTIRMMLKIFLHEATNNIIIDAKLLDICRHMVYRRQVELCLSHQLIFQIRITLLTTAH